MAIHAASTGRKPGVLINRDFALLWVGQTISTLGDWVFDLTLVLWIATRIARGQPWAPLAVSGVLLATSLPTLVVGPVAGVFVDRWDKRRTMLVMDALRAVLIALLALTSGLVRLPMVAGGALPVIGQLASIYAVVVLHTVCAQFFGPSRFALIGDIVAEPDRPQASGQEQVTANLAQIVGPALAAPLFFGLGVQWALIVNALSFVVSFLAVLAVHAPPSATSLAPGQQRHLLGEFAAGLRFFRGNQVLRTILVSIVFVVLGFGALNALNIFFVTENLHTPARLFSFTTTAVGVGAVAGATLAALFASRLGVVRTFWMSIMALGVLVLAYARLTSFAPALVLLGLLGVPNAAANVTIGPIMLHVTPREFIGRVSGVLTPLVSAASMLSLALAGLLDSTVLRGFHATLLGVAWSPVDTIFTGTGLLTVVGGLYAMVNLRGVTLAGDRSPLSGSVEGPEDRPR